MMRFILQPGIRTHRSRGRDNIVAVFISSLTETRMMLSVRPPWRSETSLPNRRMFVTAGGFSRVGTAVGVTCSVAVGIGSSVAVAVADAVDVAVADGGAVGVWVGVEVAVADGSGGAVVALGSGGVVAVDVAEIPTGVADGDCGAGDAEGTTPTVGLGAAASMVRSCPRRTARNVTRNRRSSATMASQRSRE